MALKNDHTVWVWGGNHFGIRGNGSIGGDLLVPVQVPDLENVKDIFTTVNQYYVLKNDGTVMAWGVNYDESLGTGGSTIDTHPVPAPVTVIGKSSIGNIGKIFPGMCYTLVLDDSSKLWAWGRNKYGNLGDGTTNHHSTPIVVSIDHVKEVIPYGYTVIAVKDDGTVLSWDLNDQHNLGDGSTHDKYSPQKMGGLSDIIAACPEYYALKNDGTLYEWRDRVGIAPPFGSSTPRKTLFPISDVVKISGSNCGNHLVLKADNTVWAWGDNRRGCPGIGYFSVPDRTRLGSDGYIYTPVQVLTDPSATLVPTIIPPQPCITPAPTLPPNYNTNSSTNTSVGTITTTPTPKPTRSPTLSPTHTLLATTVKLVTITPIPPKPTPVPEKNSSIISTPGPDSMAALSLFLLTGGVLCRRKGGKEKM